MSVRQAGPRFSPLAPAPPPASENSLSRLRRAMLSIRKRAASPPPAERRSFEDAVCERWAQTHDATAAVVNAPAPGIALILRGGHRAVLSLPGWAARGPACAADDDGIEIRLCRDGDAPRWALPLLHCRALLADEVAVLFDAREGAADDAQARWVHAATEKLAGQPPLRGGALARLIVVLEALWEVSTSGLLDELFAAAAAVATTVAAEVRARRAAKRAAAEAGRESGDRTSEILSIVLRNDSVAATLSTVDVLACRATCSPWCRVASDPACFARLKIPADSEPPRLRAWLHLAAGNSAAWSSVMATHPANHAVQAWHTPTVVTGTQLDLTRCESIAYAELLRETRHAAAVITSLRLLRLKVTGVPCTAPGVLIPAQLRSLAVAAPLLRDIVVCRIAVSCKREFAALVSSLESWAHAEDVRRVELRFEELVIDATKEGNWLQLPYRVMALTKWFNAPMQEKLMRLFLAADRVLLRLPRVLDTVLDPPSPQNWEHLRQCAAACFFRDFAALEQQCSALQACMRQLTGDKRVTVQMVA